MAKEVHGSCRWIEVPDENGRGALRINGEDYDVQAVFSPERRVVAWKIGEHTVTVGRRLSCDCPDYQVRRWHTEGGCKHCAALRAALASLTAHGPQ